MGAAENGTATARESSATGLTIRRLELDLSQGFPRHWSGGDAFASQFHNALSMSFPVGEQSFIDAVREGAKLLPDTPEFALQRDTVAQFIGQEATHRHIHALYNAELENQGLVNRWQDWATRRIAFARSRGIGARHMLAVTAAYEHLTAVLADYLLRHDTSLDKAEPLMRTLWRWHAAEETEHRAVAFDLYVSLKGSYGWRVRWYVYAMLIFTMECTRQTVLNLWHDGTLFKPRTWWNALRLFCGANGLIRRCTGPMLAYLRRDFHPDQEADATPGNTSQELAQRWLRDNAASYRVVR
jgi:uncharacterized protein